jgi:cytochrome c oxidase subunit 2
MDAQSIITSIQLLLVVIFGLVCANLYLVLRLKNIDPFAKWNPHAINGGLFLAFLVVGMIAATASSIKWYPTLTLTLHAASEHGVKIDRMFWNTMIITILVVVITNTLLFYYAWRYQAKPGRKALFYPHNNRLEIIWTVIPAIVLVVLIFDGAMKWTEITAPAPKDAIRVEVNGKQFAWTFRYAGADLEMGESAVNYIDEGKANDLGINLADKRGYDDIVATELHVPVGRPVELLIKSRDVLHSATLAHFRVKMDAVPGMTTRFWFTPTKTTAEMREIMKNPEFNYEMSCQQICGGGHWNMGRTVVVDTEEDYQAWLEKQKTFAQVYEEVNGVKLSALSPSGVAANEEGETPVALKN